MSWFTVDGIDEKTYVISECAHPEETHCYLLIGNERCLLIDTGLGVANISEVTGQTTNKPIIAAATHIHWDHIGGHRYFPEFYANAEELEWLRGKFPLPVAAIKKMLSECALPDDFDLDGYSVFQGSPSRLLNDGDKIELGGRTVTVLHTPGHSPGHMCFWEERGNLFTGDLVYKGNLFANYPSTDPEAYLRSLKKIAKLPVKRVFPGHHSLDVQPVLIREMAEEFERLKYVGKLRHGSGLHEFAEWSVLL